MRVLVTGGAGFIGSTLTDRLLAEGHDVTVVDDLSVGRLSNLDAARDKQSAAARGRFRFVHADVAQPSFPALAVAESPEVVCHLAAQPDVRRSVADPFEDARRNVLGTIGALEGARQSGARKLVFTTSGGTIYGERGLTPVTERASLAPGCPYAAAKGAGELYLQAYRQMYGLQTTALALGNVYGPRQDPQGEAGVAALFAHALLRGEPTVIYGDGTAVRDYVYVDDAVDALVRALGPAADGRRLNIGTGRATTVRGLHTLLAAEAGCADTPRHAPARTGELQAIVLDPTAARQALGWQPWTALEEGLARTVAWLRSAPARDR